MRKKVILGLGFLFVWACVWGRLEMLQAATLTSSGVTYNSDSSATLSRTQQSKIQVPGQLINSTQSWVAVRMKMGFAANTSLSPDPIIWDMSELDPSDLFVYFDVGSDRFRIIRRKSASSGGYVYSATQTFTAGTTLTVVGAWTSGGVKISVNGGPFLSATSSPNTIPAAAPFLIGSSLQQGSGRQPNSDYYWVAAGTGTLSDADALTMHGFGNNDRALGQYPGSPVFLWHATSDEYLISGSNPTTPTPTSLLTPTRTPTPSPTTIPGGGCRDVNGDGQITLTDLRRHLSSWGSTCQSGVFSVVNWLGYFMGSVTGSTPTVTRTPTPTVTPGSNPTATPTRVSTCTYPSQLTHVTNWTQWKITLPVFVNGSNEVKQLANFKIDPWFIPTTDCSGVQFRAHTSAPTTTDNSRYPRSELRERTANGSADISWSNSSGTHTMIIDQKVTRLPNKQRHLVVGQIHDSNDDVTVFRVEGSDSNYNSIPIQFWATIGDNTHGNKILDGYTLGERFQVKFVATPGRIETFYKGQNDANFRSVQVLHQTISGAYFKAGAYTQSNCDSDREGSGCSADNYGEVIIYSVIVEHR